MGSRDDCVESKRRREAETCQTPNGFLKRPVKLSDDTSDAMSSNSRQKNCISGYLEPWCSLVQDEDHKQLPMSIRVRCIPSFQDVVVLMYRPISTTSGRLNWVMSLCIV